jgi:hypothetical protein
MNGLEAVFISEGARASFFLRSRSFFSSNSAEERIEALSPLHRIALESHLIGECEQTRSGQSAISWK